MHGGVHTPNTCVCTRHVHSNGATSMLRTSQTVKRAQRSRGGPTAATSVTAPPDPADRAAPEETANAPGVAEAAPQVLAGKTGGVVGCGPGGMLCAAHLARLGATVEVFERFDPRAVDESRAPPAVWSIALSDTASAAIAAAGLNPDFGPKWKCAPACMHALCRREMPPEVLACSI